MSREEQHIAALHMGFYHRDIVTTPNHPSTFKLFVFP